MIAFIFGALLGGALGMLLMAILQDVNFDYQDENEEDDDDKA